MAATPKYNAGLPGLKVSTSSTPQYADADCLGQKSKTKKVCADWDEQKWEYGRGISCTLKCESCGKGNTKLLVKAEYMQCNGNSSSRREIHCTPCGTFSTIETWEAG